MVEFFKKKEQDKQPSNTDDFMSFEHLVETDALRKKEIQKMLDDGKAKKITKTDGAGKIIREEIVDQNGQLLEFLDVEGLERVQDVELAKLNKRNEELEKRLRLNKN